MKGKGFLENRGPISWMVHNRVTPNLLMIFLLLGGLFMTTRIKQEVFPEFDLDMVTVSVDYTGAGPEEVEQGIILAVEEAIRAIDGVKELTATAREGNGTVMAELSEGGDQQKIYQEIQQEIDRITTFPEDAEEPEVSLVTHRREVLAMDLYGDVPEMALRKTADQVRDRLLQSSHITQVDLAGARDYEIRVEVPQERLRAFNLTLTTLTTFGGLAPMIFETSRQARFMIPMALSLGFGILFATVITLILVPCLYLLEDVHQWVSRSRSREALPDYSLHV